MVDFLFVCLFLHFNHHIPLSQILDPLVDDVSCWDTPDLQIGLGFLGAVWDQRYNSTSFSVVSFPYVYSFLHTAWPSTVLLPLIFQFQCPV